ncbi:hypothetical protein HDU85_003349 [Gaertneriomyces sp. JEL0708]|nr:hypothetical protein HDU85_003349 [Gaertneriomyces sp. JEL0708]
MRPARKAKKSLSNADKQDATWPPAGNQSPVNNAPDEMNHTVNLVPEESGKKARKSLGRRVSFAPKARCRPFEKDSGADEVSTFDLPDVSSVRRTSGVWPGDLRLSLAASTQDESYEIDVIDEASKEPAQHLNTEQLEFEDEKRNDELLSHFASLPSPQGNSDNPVDHDIKAPSSNPSPKRPKSQRKSMRGRDSIVGFFDVTTNNFIHNGDSSSEDDFLNEHLRSPHIHPTQSYESDDDVSMAIVDPTEVSMQLYDPSQDPETIEPAWQGNSEVAPLKERDMELHKHQDSDGEGGASLPDISMIDDFEEHSDDEEDPEDSAADMEMTQCVGSLDSIPNATLKDDPVNVDMKGFEARISPIYPQRYNEYGATPMHEDHLNFKPDVGQPVREDGVEPDRKRPRMSLAASDDTLGRFFFPTGSEELGIPEMTQDITRFAGRILPDTDDTISSEGSAACVATPTQPKQRFSMKSENYGSIPRRRPTPGPKTPAAVMPSIPIELTPLATSSAISESNVEEDELSERLPNPESFRLGCQAPDESPLAVKPPKNLVSAGRSAEVSFADTDGGGDLMNEELSLVDGSFLEESQPQNIKTVQDFLQATGIYFQDTLTTNFRRETNAYLRTTEPPTEIDYCKAAMMWNSELAAYEMGCRLLYSEIEGIRESLKNIVDEAEESTPLIFYDVSECSPPEHGEITRQLKGTRSFTRAEAKEAWHTWRFSLMDDLAKDFAINMKNLTKDQRALQKLAVRYADAIAFSQKVKTEFLEELEARKDELEGQRIADEEEAAQLEQLQRDQDQKIADLRKEVANLKQACQVVEEKESMRLPEQERIKDKIAEAEKICEQLMVFDPEELGALRDEYELLVSLFPLSAIHYSPTECTFAYDQAINITLTKCEGDRYAVELSISTPKVLSVLRLIQSNLLPASRAKTLLMKAVDVVSHTWNLLRRLHEDVEFAREEFTVQFVGPRSEDDDPKHTIGLRSRFFRPEPATQFDVIIWIPLEEYPGGSWLFEVDALYGNISQKEIELAAMKVEPTSLKVLEVLRQIDRLTEKTE